MLRFSQLCESIASTTKKNQKVRLVADYFRAVAVEEAALAALYLSGRSFARQEERVLSIGFSLLLHAVARVVDLDGKQLGPVIGRHGDLGAAAEEVLPKETAAPRIALAELPSIFSALGLERGPAAKQALLEKTLRRLSALEAKYFIKVASGELRIGLQESLVEESIALAYGQALTAVQRANMLLGGIAETLRLAAAGRLADVHMAVFRPVSAMLATPTDTAEDLLDAFPAGALVEDKFDGIRAQVHKRDGRVEIYSRTLNRVTEFPELAELVRQLPGEFILDGEIIGWREGRAIPFTELQQRLGRKQMGLFTSMALPVSFVAFDLLLIDGQDLLDEPLLRRRTRLAQLLAAFEQPGLQFTRPELCRFPEEIDRLFRASLARGNEGLLAKAPDSPYVPGRRGQFWLKLKEPLATLDVVVTAVEYGHGKRRGLLSDYTFAVREGQRLVDIGKAYSGLTDAEIRQMTEFFVSRTVHDQGFRRRVTPEVVLEVAFNNIQRSKRHDSGYALRFPRIVRLRPDKSVSEIDTIERVREIFASQHARKIQP